LLLALAAVVASCGRSAPDASRPAFDSDTVQRLPAQIQDGVVLLPPPPAGTADANAYYRAAVQQLQLKYVVGLLRDQRATIGHTDSPSIDASDFRITDVKDADAGLKEVHYALDLQALWPLRTTAPTALPLLVPGRFEAFTPGVAPDVAAPADERLFATFGARCLMPDSEPPTAGNAWYDYDPSRSGCPLAALVSAAGARPATQLVTASGETMARFALTFGAAEAPSGKHPDYAGLWRDGLLRVLVVSTPIEGPTSPGDISVWNLQYAQRTLAARFHEVSRVKDGAGANGQALEEKVVYDVGGGRKIELAMLHADGFWGDDAPNFFGRIAALSAPASVVYYAGHSSYGSAIRRLAELVEVRPATPQIYYIDGCSTYFYSGQTALWDKVRAANPGPVPPGRFANLIVNGDAELSNANGPNLATLLFALVGGTASYHEILAKLGRDSRPVVIGEEANPD
jgi:hypothetical protein